MAQPTHAEDGLQISLAQLKRQMVRDVLHDARIFAAHRENHAGQNPLVAASSNRKEVALLSLTPADLALASRKHDGSSWRPPPRQVIMNIADEVNSRPLDTISFATINQAD